MFTIQDVEDASTRLHGTILRTPLQKSARLSELFESNVYLKREDLQTVRSFKIRGAYNAIVQIPSEHLSNGVVCASAGNHAQGVAYACSKLKIKGYIFMPTVTPNQKIEKVKYFGKDFVEVILNGDSFDEAYKASVEFCEQKKSTYIHPFNDDNVIIGQATIAKEVLDELPNTDYIFTPIGGGGIGAGIANYAKQINPNIKIIGVEATGGASMAKALKNNKPTKLDTIDTFVDGTAVKLVGDITYDLVSKYIDQTVDVSEGLVCKHIIELYQKEGIITEPAGALSVSALASFKSNLENKNVVCIISGGNNDLQRYPEIVERALIYEGLKHYFIINFKQKPGELKKFLLSVLGPNDDIVRFEYIKKTNAEKGPAFVGIEQKSKDDYPRLVENMIKNEIDFKEINSTDMLYRYLV